MPRRSVKRIIEQFQKDPDPLQRAAAARELCQFKDRASFGALKFATLGGGEKNLDVCKVALEALEGHPEWQKHVNAAKKKLSRTNSLIETLQEHYDPLNRADAAIKLQGRKDNSSFRALVAALDDQHFSVTSAAAKALAGRHNPRAVKPLINSLRFAILQEDSFKVREFAKALGELADPRALAPMIESLGEVKEWVQSDISEALAGFGEIGVPPLIEALNHANAQIRAGAVSALTILAPRALEALVNALRDGMPNARQGAATALSGAPSPEAVDALVTATVDTEADVVHAAVRSLGKLRNPRALDALVALLNNPNVWIRVAAVEALGKLEDRRAVDPLIVTLADSELRAEAERSIVALGAVAIDPLARLLRDARSDIGESVAKVLSRLGSTAEDVLLDSLASPEWRQRKSAAVGLSLVFRSKNDPPFDFDRLRRGMAAVKAIITDTHAEVRSAIAEALGKALVVANYWSANWRSNWEPPTGYPRTSHHRDPAEIKIIDDLAESGVHCLVQALEDSDPRVRRSAAAALGGIRSPATRGVLLGMLKRPIETERTEAAKALIRAHDGQDATGIVAALTDRDARVRYATVVAIMSLTSDIKSKGYSAVGGFFLMKDYRTVFIPQAASQIVAALARLVKEETNTQILRAALRALEMIGSTIRYKREYGESNIEYHMTDSDFLANPSQLHLETVEEIVAREAVASEVQRSEADRFTDLCVYEGHLFPGDNSATARRLSDEEALCAGREYTLEVAIRRERFGIAAATSAPRAVLNPRRTTETLKIFVVVKLFGPITIYQNVAALDWPCDADSSPAFFRLTVPETISKPEEVRVEVRLYHQNLDLLDVVNLSFFVAAEGETDVLPFCVDWPRSSKAEPCIDPDSVIRKLSIRIGIATEGFRLEFIFLRGDQTISFPFERYVTTGDLESLLTKVRDFWTELVITNYESRLSVTSTTWNRYLARLHDLGAEAWEMLFGSRVGSQKGAPETIGDLLSEMELASGTHLQITYDRRTTNFVFPWSILYPPIGHGATVDPLLFWGARYQIEQVWEGGSHDGLESEPVSVAVFVDPGFGEVQPEINMFETFKANAGGRLEIGAPVANRQGLFMALAGPPSRHLYYFFCHGYAPAGPQVIRRDGVKLLRETLDALPSSERRPWDTLLALTAKMADEAWMFIGDALISESELRRVRNFFTQRRPIIFLNMCHSAALMPSMTRGLLRLFLDRDAAAVIGTESPMTSVFAHAFARELFKHLFGGSDVGTALWRARRHFLNDNFRNPLGLAYTLYGRATAKLGVGPLITSD